MNESEKLSKYRLLNAQLKSLLAEQSYSISNLANASALLWDSLSEQVFTGFYLYDGKQLILGPFQGSVSCVEIALGQGVCGRAAEKRRPMLIADVKQEKNYISCDSRAQSEMVIPLLKNGELLGVLDLDAASKDFYDENDLIGLQKFVEIFCEMTDFKFFKVGK